ncbi:SDR family oxidoreductase [Modestobacter marinus]|uniref:NADP-dependent 3-hydroxy acid dehydrogenase YdfG n=1 Tax=Modestobacter marinus TaxID=477641 RepID=A0A846LR43_9ACTN|nr:SDR family oxidoreductase [Modestobacter marinus]NIH69941.1 NADP-dependent 3-hydroxy acid dehydrogenase YdfG [Modestobacter marinus]GGL82533.1 putative oxidoreductase [Modestobacter marinus]
MPHPLRQRIFITGASAGLGQGMAREFAARGRDLVLVARRLDRLSELRGELLARHPGIRVVVGELDVDDPEAVAETVPRLAGQLGGIDRFVANAGIGKGAPVGTGHARPNRQVLVTNVLGTHASCEAAVALFRSQGSGHLVVISSVAGVRGMGGTRTAYATSKAADAVLAEGIRADLLGDRRTRDIRVTTIHPGFIETDINTGRRGPFTVDLPTGVTALTAAIEREPVRAYVPEWPWRPVAGLLRVLPLPVVRKLA